MRTLSRTFLRSSFLALVMSASTFAQEAPGIPGNWQAVAYDDESLRISQSEDSISIIRRITKSNPAHSW